MKKYFITFLLAIFIGSLSYYYFNKNNYQVNAKEINYATLIQIGVYQNYNNAVKLQNKYHGYIEQKDNYYYVYYDIIVNSSLLKDTTTYLENNNQQYYINKVSIDDTLYNTLNKNNSSLNNYQNLQEYFSYFNEDNP